jgi:hypothetical protein
MNPERTTYLFGFAFVAIMLLVGIALFIWAPVPTAADANAMPISRLIYALVGASSLGAVVLLSSLGAIVVIKMAIGTIDLRYLVAEQDGSASLSRFQMLLFTFVIAALYFLYSLYALYSFRNGEAIVLPEIPGSVLGLMGISGGSYLLAKGISAASTPAPSDTGNPPIRKNNQ